MRAEVRAEVRAARSTSAGIVRARVHRAVALAVIAAGAHATASCASEAACERGWAMIERLDDATATIREFDACLQGRPAGEARAAALLVRGTVYAHLKRWQEARADFEGAIAQRQTPDFYDYTQLGNACVRLLDFDCARRTLETARAYVQGAPQQRRNGLNQSVAAMEARLRAAEQAAR